MRTSSINSNNGQLQFVHPRRLQLLRKCWLLLNCSNEPAMGALAPLSSPTEQERRVVKRGPHGFNASRPRNGLWLERKAKNIAFPLSRMFPSLFSPLFPHRHCHPGVHPGVPALPRECWQARTGQAWLRPSKAQVRGVCQQAGPSAGAVDLLLCKKRVCEPYRHVFRD